MADVKISDLPTSTTPLDGSEIIPVVQYGLTKMTTISAVRGGLALASDLTTHKSDTANPHAVTAAQVGLGNVDNTSDANKPVSTAQQTAINAKVSKTGDTMTGPLSVPAGASGTQVPQAQEVLLKSGNLSGIADIATARSNLGLGSAATRTALGSSGELYSRDSILGTVSQSGGVPTGAVIETGSNANGSYIRFANGTQICITSVASGNTSTATATAGIFASAPASQNWPATFTAAPEVSISARNSANANCWAGDYTVSATGISNLRAFSTINTATCVLAVVAIGRWF